MSDDVKLTGGCQCGRVRYALSVVPDDVSVCHCRMCQKAVGGPFVALALVHANELTWTRGKPGVFRSSTIATRLFYADCGTPLAYVNDDSGDIELTTGSFDQPDRVVPTRATGNESRLPWIDKLPSLPAQSTKEIHAARKQAPIVSFQHPDHDTPGGLVAAAWRTGVAGKAGLRLRGIRDIMSTNNLSLERSKASKR